MDSLTAALCGLGAMTVLFGPSFGSLAIFSLFAAFFGVHRALRTSLSKALIAAPAIVWLFGNLFVFLPSRGVEWAQGSPFTNHAPENLAIITWIVTLLVMVGAARDRLGSNLTTVTLIALGFALLFRLAPSTLLEKESHSPLFLSVLRATDTGWTTAARLLAGLSMLLIGIGPVAVQPLPRRGGATAGAIGAVLLAGCIASVGGLRERDDALPVVILVWIVASVLVAVGVGAMARAGAKPGGWIGLGLVVLGILSLGPSLAVFDKSSSTAVVLLLSTPFTLLGIGISLVGWTGAPVVVLRKVLGGGFIAAFAGGTLGWIGTWLELARVVHSRTPWEIAQITTAPLGINGLVLWAAFLLYLASPPTLSPPPGPWGPPPLPR